jgi:hypothetical protein
MTQLRFSGSWHPSRGTPQTVPRNQSVLHEEIESPHQGLRRLLPPLRLAQEMGAGLGPGPVLFRRLPTRRPPTRQTLQGLVTAPLTRHSGSWAHRIRIHRYHRPILRCQTRGRLPDQSYGCRWSLGANTQISPRCHDGQAHFLRAQGNPRQQQPQDPDATSGQNRPLPGRKRWENRGND